MNAGAPSRPGRNTPLSIETRIASPDSGFDAVSKVTNGRSSIRCPSNAVSVISLMRTSRTRSMKDGVGAGGGPPAAGVAAGAGVGEGAPGLPEPRSPAREPASCRRGSRPS